MALNYLGFHCDSSSKCIKYSALPLDSSSSESAPSGHSHLNVLQLFPSTSNHSMSNHSMSIHSTSERSISDHSTSDHSTSDPLATGHSTSDHSTLDHSTSDLSTSDTWTSDPFTYHPTTSHPRTLDTSTLDPSTLDNFIFNPSPSNPSTSNDWTSESSLFDRKPFDHSLFNASPSDVISDDPQQKPPLGFTYEDINSNGTLIGADIRGVTLATGSSPTPQRVAGSTSLPPHHPSTPSPLATSNGTRPWQDYPRQDEQDNKIQIPKIHTDDDKIHILKSNYPFGCKFHLETPISTSQRREDDRMTYINKGQFYCITMDFIPDPDKPLKNNTVKSVVMLMFREEKTPEDEQKSWHFWHGRQHSTKQRIIDVDTKNSAGIVGNIEEISHNAIVVYWNPMESTAKINVAIQCLSTDFSSQKGVKGLPLHVQIDTFDEPRDNNAPVYHRGYCQIKVFCDKGAERKTRDEERRAHKRRMSSTSRKKYEDMYHPTCDRSEFYSMMDLEKETVLFNPSEDPSYMNMEMQTPFYSQEPENGSCGAATMDIPTAPTSTSPTSISPHSHHLPNIPNPTHSMSPSPMSSHPHSLTSLSIHSSGHNSVMSHSDLGRPSPPPASAATLLLLSNSSVLATVSSSNLSQHQLALTSVSQGSPMDSSHLYQTSPSPLSLQLNQSSSANNLSTTNTTHISHTSNNQSLHHQHPSLAPLSSPRDTGHYPSNPATPTDILQSSATSPPSSVFAKTIISPTYGEIHRELNGTVASLPSPMEQAFPGHIHKRSKVVPSPSERIMIYVRRNTEPDYTALHLVPPTIHGLLISLEEKYIIPRTNVTSLVKKNIHGVRVRMDDDMIKHYSNEDTFLVDIIRNESDNYDVTMIEEEHCMIKRQVQ